MVESYVRNLGLAPLQLRNQMAGDRTQEGDYEMTEVRDIYGCWPRAVIS